MNIKNNVAGATTPATRKADWSLKPGVLNREQSQLNNNNIKVNDMSSNKNMGRPATKNRTVSKTVRLTQELSDFITEKGKGNFSDGLNDIGYNAIFNNEPNINLRAFQVYQVLTKLSGKEIDIITRALDGVLEIIISKES